MPEQSRFLSLGSIVQGIGAALFEKRDYDARGQLINGTTQDYLVPGEASAGAG